MRHQAPHLRCRLVLAQTLIDDLAQQIVIRPGQKLASATSSGRTQCTRLKTSGDPKRLVRGGSTSSDIQSVASGCGFRHSRLSSV
jgi:hypothetical protein